MRFLLLVGNCSEIHTPISERAPKGSAFFPLTFSCFKHHAGVFLVFETC